MRPLTLLLLIGLASALLAAGWRAPSEASATGPAGWGAAAGPDRAWALYRLRQAGPLRTVNGGSTARLTVPGTISPYAHRPLTFAPAVRR